MAFQNGCSISPVLPTPPLSGLARSAVLNGLIDSFVETLFDTIISLVKA
jgi:hypothetical protein